MDFFSFGVQGDERKDFLRAFYSRRTMPLAENCNYFLKLQRVLFILFKVNIQSLSDVSLLGRLHAGVDATSFYF